MILIVDDHIDTCRVLLLLLKQEAIPAQCVTDPAAALRAAEALRPSLIVLDQMMPGLRGTDVLCAIRGVPSIAEIPAVFYSAAEDGREEARQLGALDWLSKGGMTWSDLRKRIMTANAVKYSGRGTVRVRAVQEQDGRKGGWSLLVSDEGRGIAPDHLEGIFEAFRRGEMQGRRASGWGWPSPPGRPRC